jgi:two-component system chemotaxis response regulator CheB
MSTSAALPVIRVLVVDDSGFMRIALRKIIEADGDIRVVGEARNGREALRLAQELRPDVVTMDVTMPEMDGIEATRRIVAEVSPPPRIIMVSASTQAGADATLKALRCGAADFLSKSSSFADTDLGLLDSELRGRLRQWRPAVASGPLDVAAPIREAGEEEGRADLIAVAVSTGGPIALPLMLAAMGEIEAPVVIAQHMPELFTRSLAQHLAAEIGLDVREGVMHGAIKPRTVTVLPGGHDAVVASDRHGGFELRPGTGAGGARPSADLLLQSVAATGRRPVAVILTGMGRDGTLGAAAFRRRGLPVLVQAPATCTVAGMPSAAIAAGVATEILSLEQIGKRLAALSRPGRPLPMAGG